MSSSKLSGVKRMADFIAFYYKRIPKIPNIDLLTRRRHAFFVFYEALRNSTDQSASEICVKYSTLPMVSY
uniref:Uncharacterized protein n=1 Tax=Daphnia galeata TaxID=27404 RepID=A0A8J2RFD2_9CRUS|nr:unnamed protein product [Daphnia galeata]